LPDEPVIAYAGRLSYEKGVDTLLRAFANVLRTVPAARLWIAGSGPERDKLETLANEVGVAQETEFLGALPFEEMDRLFERAWVQVVPSLWDEPFGMVAIEGLMRGTAVVASRSGGPGEIVDDGQSGILFTPGDVRELTEALTRLIQDKALCESMGQRAHAIATDRYSMDSLLISMENLYQKLIKESSAA
jgi:glycosyltransferase involved in cell wall biosynthesis